MEHGRVPPVTVTISGTSAQLIVKLVEQSGPNADGGAVLMRALGLLDLAMKAGRDGKRLAFFDPESLEFSEVAY